MDVKNRFCLREGKIYERIADNYSFQENVTTDFLQTFGLLLLHLHNTQQVQRQWASPGI